MKSSIRSASDIKYADINSKLQHPSRPTPTLRYLTVVRAPGVGNLNLVSVGVGKLNQENTQ